MNRILMTSLLSFGLLGILGVTASANQEVFYVGTYTKPGRSRGILAGTLYTETGKLGPLTLAAEAKDPSFLALSPDGSFLYAALESVEKVAAFKVEADRSLTLLNERPSGGDGPCHVSVSPSGRVLYVANYGGGTVSSFPLGGDGTLGEAASRIVFEGSGPDPKRQEKPHAHSIYPDPEGRFVYSCDLGTDRLHLFKPGSDGLLSPNDPPFASVPPAAGARHLAWDHDGKFAYVINEMGADVTVFVRERETGALVPRETVPLLPGGIVPPGTTAAEIVFHPSRRLLYASIRGPDSITVFTVGDEGQLTFLQNVPSGVKGPRSFAIDPAGKWLLVSGQYDDRLALLKIDPQDGRLTATGQTLEVGSPVCVLFVP